MLPVYCFRETKVTQRNVACFGLVFFSEKSTARAAPDGSSGGCQKNVTGKKRENGRERKDEERGGRKPKAGTGGREHHKE